MNRDEVLTTAQELISKDRAAVYGDAKDNFAQIADLWRTTFGWDVDASKVALAMVLVKVARLSTTIDHGDSWVDIARYAALGGEISYQQPPLPFAQLCRCGTFQLIQDRGWCSFYVTNLGEHHLHECETTWVPDEPGGDRPLETVLQKGWERDRVPHP